MNKLRYLLILCIFASCKAQYSRDLSQHNTFYKQEIAFVSNRDGNYEIYLMDKNGGHLLNITQHDSLDFNPAWSGKGTELYFYSKRDGNAEIYTVQSDRSTLMRLTDNLSRDLSPALSPDGHNIVFVSDRNPPARNLYLMDKDGKNVKPLTQNNLYEESPEWAPDGKRILFTRQLPDSLDTSHSGNGEIFIIDANGGNERRLTHKPGYDSGAKFSPNGKQIAFYGQSEEGTWDLFIMDAEGHGLYNLTQDSIECYSPDWSPDGRWLIYTAGNKGIYNIWKINIRTKERVPLTNSSGRNESPVWKK